MLIMHVLFLVCMEMIKNVPNFPTYRGSPFIENPLIEVPL